MQDLHETPQTINVNTLMKFIQGFPATPTTPEHTLSEVMYKAGQQSIINALLRLMYPDNTPQQVRPAKNRRKL